MKDQYVGDVNDYAKYALLRAFSAGGDMRVGLCWMLTPPDERADGRKLGYLARPEQWRAYDPPLFDALSATVSAPDGRRIAFLERSGVLPGALTVDRLVPDDLAGRGAFMRAAAEALAPADLVFFDPDNGLDVPSLVRGRRNSNKYVYRDEVAACYEAGSSVLVYQHFPRERRGPFLDRVGEELRALAPGASTWAFRTANVAFLLLIQPRHAARLEDRIREAAARWGERFIQAEPLQAQTALAA